MGDGAARVAAHADRADALAGFDELAFRYVRRLIQMRVVCRESVRMNDLNGVTAELVVVSGGHASGPKGAHGGSDRGADIHAFMAASPAALDAETGDETSAG